MAFMNGKVTSTIRLFPSQALRNSYPREQDDDSDDAHVLLDGRRSERRMDDLFPPPLSTFQVISREIIDARWGASNVSGVGINSWILDLDIISRK